MSKEAEDTALDIRHLQHKLPAEFLVPDRLLHNGVVFKRYALNDDAAFFGGSGPLTFIHNKANGSIDLIVVFPIIENDAEICGAIAEDARIDPPWTWRQHYTEVLVWKFIDWS